MTFHTEIITKFDQIKMIEADWMRLWNADPNREVFMNFGWVQAAWSAYGAGAGLATPVVYRGGEVVGILPLAHHGDSLRFLGSPRSDYNDFLTVSEPAADILGAAITTLLRDVKGFSLAVMENVPDGSRLMEGLQSLEPSLRSRCSMAVSASCPSTNFKDNRETLLDSIVNTKRLRQYERRLARAGEVRFSHLEDMESIRRHIPEFFRQHIARRAFAGDKSLFLDADSRQFYKNLVESLDPRSSLRFSVLLVDDTAVAYHFGFEDNGKFVLYKPVFNVDFWGLSPGDVLLKRLFEYVVDRGLNELDFTAGDESYKHKYANRTRNVNTVLVYNRGPGGGVVRLRTNTRRVLARNEKVVSVLRAGRSHIAGVAASISSTVQDHGWGGWLARLMRKGSRAILSLDEALIYSASGETPAKDRRVHLKEGSLSDLGVLAAHHSSFAHNKLHKARARLRDGDQLYLAYAADQITHAVWFGSRKTIDPIAQEDISIELPGEGGYIYDCWRAEKTAGDSDYSQVLTALRVKTSALAPECWTHCLRQDRDMCKNIERAGFSPRYLVRSMRIFGRVFYRRSQTLGMDK